MCTTDIYDRPTREDKVMKKKVFFYIYIIATLLLILLPLNGLVKLDKMILELRPDLLVHGVLLLPWMFLKNNQRIPNYAWALLGTLYGAALEFSQLYLPYRSFDLSDMLANTVGVLLSCMLMRIWHSRWANK